ncbi:MAG: hypothetical protein AAB037_05940 [Chloroflexota bacterium]
MWFKVQRLSILVLSLLLVLTTACRQPRTVPTLGPLPPIEEKLTPTPMPLGPSPTFSPTPAIEEEVAPSPVPPGGGVIESLARSAGVIIIGRTSSASVVEVTPREGGDIYVYVDWSVEVEQVLKYPLGLNPQRVSVRTLREIRSPSGFRRSEKVQGLAADQRYLLFIDRYGSNPEQGQFTISAPWPGAFLIKDGIVHYPIWYSHLESGEVPLQDAITRIERAVK